MKTAPRRRWLALAMLGVALCACTSILPPASRHARWLDAGHRDAAEGYAAYLRSEGVGDIVPAAALARTARRWRLCGNREFDVPPPALQANMPPTLRLVARLRDAGIVDPQRARSVYRDPAMNTCAGGSARSKHLENRAIDFDLPKRGDNVERLCAFWREHGQALDMGLGFYTPTAIHIDTAGYRTWGEDHSWRTSLCTAG
ncbi:D-Ala-D-Ala carboxypeptidase family metallohydrolase [Lysobacter hankyongensis]|uniref:D-Ala-D-Ala carboxypeptidase family metallohydrolase n=1 Tax=Lysobacter hankyongensis TaxID=1176535 RepID=A0ABP9CDG8_9GAMM